MNRKRGVLSIASIVTASLVLVACGSAGSESSGSGAGTVKIGFVNSFTGQYASACASQRAAAQLAVDETNAKNSGAKVELVTRDDQSNPAQAISQVQTLMQDKSIDGFVALCEAGIGAAALQLFAQDGRPTIYMQVPVLKNRPANVFDLGVPQNTVAEKEGKYVFGTLGPSPRVALISQTQDTLAQTVSGWKKAASNAGVDMVSDQQIALTATSFGPQISNAISANPAAIGVAMIGPADGTVVSGLRAAGYKGLIFTNHLGASSAAISGAGGAMDGVISGTYWAPAIGSNNVVAKNFVNNYAAANPKALPPDVLTMEGFDATQIMMQAIAHAGTKPADVVGFINSNSFDTGLKPGLTFDKSSGFAALDGYILKFGADGNATVVQ